MTDPIDTKELDDFLKALDRLPQEVNRFIRPALRAATILLHGHIADSADETEANVPPGIKGRWYERGFGTRTLTGKAYPTSEMLGRSWTTAVSGQGPWEGRVGTTASYAPFVQDKERQASTHRGRWGTIQDTVKEKRAQVLDLILSGIRRAIALVRG